MLQELAVLIDGVVDGSPWNWETSDRGCIKHCWRNIIGEGRGGPLSATAPAASSVGRQTIVRGVTTGCLDTVLAVQVRPAWSVHASLATPLAGNFHKAGRTLSTAAAIELEASWQGARAVFPPIRTAIPSCQRQESRHAGFAQWTKSVAEFMTKHDWFPGAHSQLSQLA